MESTIKLLAHHFVKCLLQYINFINKALVNVGGGNKSRPINISSIGGSFWTMFFLSMKQLNKLRSWNKPWLSSNLTNEKAFYEVFTSPSQGINN